MKHLITLLTHRLRAQAFGLVSRGLVRLLTTLLASRLHPATARTATTRGRHTPQTGGTIIDGEYRRVDPRHNDRW
jgi:hypothetical protein